MLRTRRGLLVLGLATALACGAGYLAVHGWRRRPNILFILVDTLRADRLAQYGRARHLTPFLDDYRDRSLVFDRAYSASAWTLPAVVSLFVGQRPFEHGVVDFMIGLPKDRVTLAETLAAQGYETAGYVATPVMTVPHTDYGQGFATFELVTGSQDWPEKPADATDVNAAALRWLETHRSRRPFFLYLHYMEPHWPYRAHPGITAPSQLFTDADEGLRMRVMLGGAIKDPERRKQTWTFPQRQLNRIRDLYDGEVKYLDRCLADLFAELDRRGVLADTIVVITADHGEELGEHELFGHGESLYEIETHVPLIVHRPGSERVGHVEDPVETAGLAAALLRAAGIDPPATFDVPPVPLDPDPREEWPTPVSQLTRVNKGAVWLHRTAVIDGYRKLLVAADGTLAVHDLRVDPAEKHPSPPTGADVARAEALDEFETLRARAPSTQPADEATLTRLRALGYVGGPSDAVPDAP